MAIEMTQQEIISLVLGILFAISEMLGVVERGPNSVIHLIFKIWGQDVKMDIDFDPEDETNNENVGREAPRVIDEDLTMVRDSQLPALNDSLLRVYSRK